MSGEAAQSATISHVILREWPHNGVVMRIGHYLAKERISLLDCLMQHFGLSREEAERIIAFGAVYQDRQRVMSNRVLSPGQYIRVHTHPKRFPVDGIDWAQRIVHEDKHFIVVNKPAGVPVHATLDNNIENVLHQLRMALNTTLHVTHRLDTEVSGLMVFARTEKFQREFNRLLADRQVRKRYRALVSSAPEVGRHVHYIEPAERSPKKVSAEKQPNWLECALRVVTVTTAPEGFELEIDLETGRTHQIRAQLSALGCPIIGDKLYGSPKPFRGGIALFSASTSWTGPDGQHWSFAAVPPWHQG
jgi:23S rRNA pseudouridine1911/1915/1917 synthase